MKEEIDNFLVIYPLECMTLISGRQCSSPEREVLLGASHLQSKRWIHVSITELRTGTGQQRDGVVSHGQTVQRVNKRGRRLRMATTARQL